MKKYEWVPDQINKLLTTDLVKEGVALRDVKLNFINLPLYKYCYVCKESEITDNTVDYNIDNFEKDILYFRSPEEFNDPFDCFLGFSQSQMTKGLLKQELRQKNQLNPESMKIVNMLFNTENYNSLDLITNSDLEPIIEVILDTIPDDDPLKSVYVDMFQSLYKQGPEMVKKLITNTMTIKDKQAIVDLMYGNDIFINFIKKNCKPENFDFVIKSAPRDMKINIENKPDSFMSDNTESTLDLFDFLNMFSKSLSGNNFNDMQLDEIKKMLNEASKKILESSRRIISEQFRITCLSERMDSPLMWSHYANKHYGFCLEYDFTSTITQVRYPDLIFAQLFLFPVYYSEKRPSLSKSLFSGKSRLAYLKNKKLPPDFLKNLIYGLLFKSKDWAYEKEWRIFQLQSKNPTMCLPKARKVFLGANMEENAKNKVIQIAKIKHIPIYQMFLHSDKYKFDYYQLK